jgi:hypothetical protein
MFDWLRKFWRRKQEERQRKSDQERMQLIAQARANAGVPFASIRKDIEAARIRELNRNRQTKFAHSEHFKRRQPTTARKLWKPGKKPEEGNEGD